ncbi:hypothetical protein HBH56_233840 [Parastagonospora nodorum]|uniref:AB hydrolase-1 domain-containing protein n=1 Tax=Phaeosphaeria nodorum (strain SN15 / ATCC MYA-4574 / FGSC 10173) TaxID=321614 RepID=A0A7U2F3P6_PHANO|nr:hypothetical protein HBH56_233840 [Parastagonospora nodorum]QRC97038.1 hypothetical protein JI435_140660 [Parastagonospora nodorum SN15]KAH3921336.1 hypothetical protein HBH54_241900 [Parastagonospora nodorum]KAH3944456.1 hypothetical protein HBH53_158350 [Parastagonospora nodorum]KAH3959398.1 hypothetical protein HBH52_245150 [Parastagonospora nodorum]
MDVQTQKNPPVPAVHADAANAPPNQSLRPPRKPSPPSAKGRRSPNYVHTQAASPAIISSLIDQLSAISAPAHDHFENLLVGYNNGHPASAKTSIHTHSARNSTAGHDGSSIDHSVYSNSLREQNDTFPDDACEPPVIRTSKPPSGFSPLTAPKKKDKSHSLSGYIGRSSGSSASLHSTHSNHSAVSIGNISIEAGIPRQPSGGSARSSSESKRSGKVHRGLMYMSSRERLRQKETERKRHTTHNSEDAMAHDSPRKNSVPLFPYEDTIKEEPTSREEDQPFPAEPSRFAQRYPDRSNSPRRLRINLVDGPEGESPSEQGIIPERGSSLKHAGSPTRKSRKSRASGANRKEQQKPEVVAKEPEKLVEAVVTKDKILKELEEEENEVAQRIRELREQKLRRDLLAGKQPVGIDAGVSASGIPQVSVIPSPEASPTSIVSSASERRVQVQDPTKAHKILGITREEAGAEKPIDAEIVVDKTEARKPAPAPITIFKSNALRHSRHRSLTVNDGDDLTPLPINYNLAVQKAEEISPPTPTIEVPRARSPPPPSISVASSKETNSSVTLTRRSSSAATVGGRSAVGRRATSSTLMGTTKSHQHSSSVSDGIDLKPPSVRSASADIGARHHSMIMPLSAPNSFQLQRKKTLTKKRWSHPDLPAKAEKRHNDKVERMEQEAAALGVGAVQRPPRPIAEERIEERPASVDSIDLEVDSYLNSSRLSQKIRHPQTGRVISFSEVGDPSGFAVFVCVGMGLTRYVMAFYDQLAATLKLRLITPDRPGVGGSQVDQTGTPLSWPDDVLIICQALKITKFSMLAHSAGAIYALATSLRMPQHIRGRVHLLAPWIPPSQMAPIGLSQDSPPTQQLPRSQRFLRALPPSLLKVANSTFLGATSASLQRSGPKNSPKTRRKSIYPQTVTAETQRPSLKDNRRESMMLMDQVLPHASSMTLAPSSGPDANYEAQQRHKEQLTLAEREHQRAFDERLTFAIWDRATAHANPATDLMVCLETKQTIGFRYEDINRPVVIHHGSKDSRVPVDNVRWLGKLMRKCEVRILEGEQHGLMASAQVMGNVLTEVASEWEDWSAVVQGKGDHRSLSRRRTAERLRSTVSRDDMRLTTH